MEYRYGKPRYRAGLLYLLAVVSYKHIEALKAGMVMMASAPKKVIDLPVRGSEALHVKPNELPPERALW